MRSDTLIFGEALRKGILVSVGDYGLCSDGSYIKGLRLEGSSRRCAPFPDNIRGNHFPICKGNQGLRHKEVEK